MKTNRVELISQLRRAIGELEKPNNTGSVTFDILDITDFCFEQEFLNEDVNSAESELNR